jgi:hypothetical protein
MQRKVTFLAQSGNKKNNKASFSVQMGHAAL